MTSIILPGTPLFQQTLDQTALWWTIQRNRGMAYAQGTDGLFRAMTPEEMHEYLHGGEMEEVHGTFEEDESLDD